jgi:hypothetical protein
MTTGRPQDDPAPPRNSPLALQIASVSADPPPRDLAFLQHDNVGWATPPHLLNIVDLCSALAAPHKPTASQQRTQRTARMYDEHTHVRVTSSERFRKAVGRSRLRCTLASFPYRRHARIVDPAAHMRRTHSRSRRTRHTRQLQATPALSHLNIIHAPADMVCKRRDGSVSALQIATASAMAHRFPTHHPLCTTPEGKCTGSRSLDCSSR